MNDIIIKTGEILGSVPGAFSDRNPKVYQALSIAKVLFLLLIAAYPIAVNIQGLINSHMAGGRTADYAFDIATYIFFAALTVISAAYKNILYIDDYKYMKHAFREIDVILKQETKFNVCLVTAAFVLYQILFVCFSTFRYIFKSLSVSDLYFFCSTVGDYISLIDILIAWRILVNLKNRLETLNKYLNKLREPTTVYVSAKRSHKENWCIRDEQCVLELIEVHSRIVKNIHIFNTLYGASIILLNLLYFVEFLSTVLHIIDIEVDAGEVYLDFIAACFNLISWLVFVINAQLVIDEGQLLIENCLEVMTVSLDLYDNVSDKWRIGMAHLTQCVITHKPEFTAANFYRVDVSAIFTILNMMTGYIVVVVQFFNGKSNS